jgi:hypothetical protein
MHRLLVLLFLAMILIPQSSQAILISAFLKHPEEQQRVYALGAVSMLAFSVGINGDPARTKCITDWYEAKGTISFSPRLPCRPRPSRPASNSTSTTRASATLSWS